MAIRVKLPNGQYGNFPDDMPHDQIEAVLRKQFPPESSDKGFSGIGQDIQQSVEQFPEYAVSMAQQLPEEIDAAVHMPLGRSLKNIGEGTKGIGQFLVNPAGPGMKYLAEKEIPYISALAKKWPQFGESDTFGLGEQQPGDVLWQSAVPGGLIGKGTKGIKGLRGLAARSAGAGTYAGSQGENPIQAALAGSVLEGAFKAPRTLKGGVEAIPSKISGVKESSASLTGKAKGKYSQFREPFEQLKQQEDLADKLKRGLVEREQKFGKEVESSINPYLDQQLQDIESRTAKSESNINKLFPEVEEPELLEKTMEQFKNEGKKIIDESNKLYSEFGKSEHGTKIIEQPFNHKEFSEAFSNIAKIPKSTMEGAKNKASSIKISSLVDAQGKPLEVRVPPKNASANDYIELMRDLRDISHDLRQKAKDANRAESLKLHDSANKIKALQESTAEKIKSTIGDEVWRKFNDIQEHYAKYRAPLNEEVALRNPVYNDKLRSNPYKTLFQPKYKALRERLMASPSFKEQYIQHSTQGGQHPLKTGIEGLKAHTRSNLNPEQRKALEVHESVKEQKEQFEKLRSKIMNADKLLESEREILKKYSPKARKFVDRVLHEKAITKQMEQEGKNLGFSKVDMQGMVKKREKWINIAKTVGSIKGVDLFGAALKKAFGG